MKLIFALLLTFCIAFAQAQKITDMPTTTGNPAGAWVPIVQGGMNKKIDAKYFGYNSPDSFYVSHDTIFFKNTNTSVIGFVKLPATASGLDVVLANGYSSERTAQIKKFSTNLLIIGADTLTTGYVSRFEVNPTTGNLVIYNGNGETTVNNNLRVNNALAVGPGVSNGPRTYLNIAGSNINVGSFRVNPGTRHLTEVTAGDTYLDQDSNHLYTYINGAYQQLDNDWTKFVIDSLKSNRFDTSISTSAYIANANSIGSEWENAGSSWFTTTGGITTASTGKDNYLMLNYQYNFNRKRADVGVILGADTKMLFYTRNKEPNDALGTMMEIDAAAGAIRIYKTDTTSNAALPPVWAEKAYSFVAGRPYVIRMQRINKANELIIIDRVTGAVDSLVVVGDNAGRQYDAYAVAVESGTPPLITSFKVFLGSKKHIRVVFVGDSITDAKYLANLSDGFPYLFANLVGVENVMVSGRGSGTITGVQNRAYSELAYVRPDYAVVMIGTNGGNSSGNITTLVNTYRALGIEPIICTTPWRSGALNVARNATIVSTCNSLSVRVVYMDSATSKNYAGAVMDTSKFNIETDGVTIVHPNAAGHLAMFKRLLVDAPELLDYNNYQKLKGDFILVGKPVAKKFYPFSGHHVFTGSSVVVNARFNNTSAPAAFIGLSGRGTVDAPAPKLNQDEITALEGISIYDSLGNYSSVSPARFTLRATQDRISSTTMGARAEILVIPNYTTDFRVGLMVSNIGNAAAGFKDTGTTQAALDYDTLAGFVANGLRVDGLADLTVNDSITMTKANSRGRQGRIGANKLRYHALDSANNTSVQVLAGDLNNIAGTCDVYAGTNALNKPLAGNGYVVQLQQGSGERFQTYYQRGTTGINRIFFRVYVTSVWTSWNEVQTTAYTIGATTAATGFLTSQTTSQNIATYTVGAIDSSFEVAPWIIVTSVSGGTITGTVTYTDITNTSRTLTLYSLGTTTAALSATGPSNFPTVPLKAKASTAITYAVTVTGTIGYSAGAKIIKTP